MQYPMADKPTNCHHVFAPETTYMVTAGTLHKEHLVRGHERLKLLEKTLSEIMKARCWKIRARALFSTHYHWIGVSPETGSIRRLIQHLHSES
jgi:putative transposase